MISLLQSNLKHVYLFICRLSGQRSEEYLGGGAKGHVGTTLLAFGLLHLSVSRRSLFEPKLPCPLVSTLLAQRPRATTQTHTVSQIQDRPQQATEPPTRMTL